MKKILMSLFILLMLSVSVFAANGNGGSSSPSTAPSPTGMPVDAGNEDKGQPEAVQLKLSTMLQERLQNKGLENALINVKNANAQDRLSKAMEKIELKNQVRLQALNGLVISEEGEESFSAQGEKQDGLKYLSFIKFQRSHKYQLFEDGTMLREQKGSDWLFEQE